MLDYKIYETMRKFINVGIWVNRHMIRIVFALIALIIFTSTEVVAQRTTKITRDQEYRDSIENAPHEYVFPIWGGKVQKMGYDLPLPAGLYFGWVRQNQDILITDLEISIGGSEFINIDELVEFSRLNNTTNVLTFRPDVWVFPFLNVYAIATIFDAVTEIKVSEPIEIDVPDANNQGYGLGFGMVGAYGIGRAWVSGNFNFAWSNTPRLVEPTQSFSMSLRVGTDWHTKNRKHVINPYIGASYIDYFGSNGGTYDMTQLIPDDGDALDNLLEQVQGMLDELNEKYEDFCAQPGNGPKCTIIDPLLEEFKSRIEDKIDGIEVPDELPLDYKFSSAPAKNWNMVVGMRYQHNKRWDYMFEAGLGNRSTFMVSATWRFGIKQRKYR